MKTSALTALLLLLMVGAALSATGDSNRPNVVFILADDLGWGDLSCHGSSFIKTPAIDRLAAEGTDFHEFNTASPVCSPSRAAFMTGMFPARFGIRSAIGGINKNRELPQVDWLDPQAATLPRLLRDAGYVTGHFGKWHLQSSQATDAPMPADYGVQEVGLFPGTAHPDTKTTVTDHGIWDAATAFLKRHKDHPFYLNIWTHETHLAHYPTPESLEANKHLDERQRIYAAVATDADRGVGRILAALDELGLSGNTLIVFSSDNGPENTHATMKEMRGGYGGYYSVGETGGQKGRKRSLHEGGVSTPFIVRWPGRVPAGRVDKSTVISATDLLPTVCAAAGVELPTAYRGDGESVLPALKGEALARTKPLFWDWTGAARPDTNWCRWAVRDGDWKLLTDDRDRVELYRIPKDAAEAHDVAKEHPEVVAKMQALLTSWKASLPKEPPANCLSKLRARRAAK